MKRKAEQVTTYTQPGPDPLEGDAAALLEEMFFVRIPDRYRVNAPSMEELEDSYIMDGERPTALCGCETDPDGRCARHNAPSWGIFLGVI